MIRLKLRRKKKSQLKEHQKGIVRGNKLLETILKGQNVIELKENGKRVADKYKYCNKIYKADSSKNGMKNLKNHFPKCPDNPDNQSK